MTANLQNRVARLEAARRAADDALTTRFVDFLERHWPGACAANPDLETENEAFYRDCDAAALAWIGCMKSFSTTPRK
jgi:hypothetical protein